MIPNCSLRTETGADVPDDLRSPQTTIAYLQRLDAHNKDLIFEHARWPLEAAPESAIDIFIADTVQAESLPRREVFDYLKKVNPSLAIRYLEHIIKELGDMSPDFHNELALLYVEFIKGWSHGDDSSLYSEKLLLFLRESEQYRPGKIISSLPREDAAFLEARAVLLRRMGQHQRALQIYVFEMKHRRKAEE